MANLDTPGVNLGTFQVFHRDSGSGEGPLLELRRVGGSQADSDSLGAIHFYGEDDGDAAHIYAAIRARAVDVTNATEDGALDLRASVAGTLTTMATVDSDGITFPNSAGAFGLNATEQFGSDADITYSRATHGDLATFFYGASVVLSQQRNLTFPYDEGVTGGMVIIRVKEDASYPVNVRLEDPANPGTYSEVLVENSTRIVRKSVTDSWWTDMGNWIQNGNQVALRGESAFVIETHENETPRLIMLRNTDGTEQNWHAFRIDSSGSLVIRDNTAGADRMKLRTSGDIDFLGSTVASTLSKVVTSVSGTLTAATHSGNTLVTSGNVTVPTTAGFNCILIFGGAHTITFNLTTSAAMASGDIVSVVVQSATVIKASKIAAADLVAFS